MNATVKVTALSGTPQVIVSIHPETGNLQGTLSDGRTIEFAKNPIQSLYTILLAQAAGEMSMGQNGAPTRHQLWHWEQHSTSPNERCTFCRREGKIKVGGATKKGKQAQREATVLPLEAF